MTSLLTTLISSLAARLPHNYGPIGHLKVIRQIWPQVVRPPALVIDATCGNGNDAEFIASLLQMSTPQDASLSSSLYCIDLQSDALLNSRDRLLKVVHPTNQPNLHFLQQSHDTFPAEIKQNTVSMICYNLGYLPGLKRKDDGFVRTVKDTTITSLSNAIPLLKENGLLSVTAYLMHDGGEEEANAVRDFMVSLPEADWRVYAHVPLNRPKSPHLYLAYKIGKSGIF